MRRTAPLNSGGVPPAPSSDRTGLTDKELERMPLPEFKKCGYSTIRKRRTDLYQQGFVRPTDEIRDGCTVWEPVPILQVVELQEQQQAAEKPQPQPASAGRLF